MIEPGEFQPSPEKPDFSELVRGALDDALSMAETIAMSEPGQGYTLGDTWLAESGITSNGWGSLTLEQQSIVTSHIQTQLGIDTTDPEHQRVLSTRIPTEDEIIPGSRSQFVTEVAHIQSENPTIQIVRRKFEEPESTVPTYEYDLVWKEQEIE